MIGSPHLAGNADAPTGVVYGVDLGSGAGLPGMVLALAGYPTSDTDGTNGPALALRMTLVEATGRKASFLRTVSRETSVPVTVDNRRIEAAGRAIKTDIDFLTARALAPLDTLIKLADPWLVHGATGFFHKGGEYARELREWPDANAYDVVEHRSRIDPNSRILQITRRDADLARQA